MLTGQWNTIESVGHDTFAAFGTGFLGMLKDNIFTETNVLYVSIGLLFTIGLFRITSFLFQDNE